VCVAYLTNQESAADDLVQDAFVPWMLSRSRLDEIENIDAYRMQATEELHQICAYACFRKESSKAGSVLILRFFHNYFPTEIAGVMNSSRNCVDQWQRLARREAKLFMNQPRGLRFVNGEAPARTSVRYLGSDLTRQLIISADPR
jgi:DNA-directed RNA polymerase specialized sigma24 family protein